MTRKRFTKLLMSVGYYRNEANDKADKMRSLGLSYDYAWYGAICAKNLITGLAAGIEAFTPVLADCCKALGEAAAKAAVAMRAFGTGLAGLTTDFCLADELETEEEAET